MARIGVMVAVWALGATAGAQDRCALSGSVRVFADVQPRGTAPFAVEVEGPTLTARPRANGMWDIEVAEPLAFAARATDVPVRLAREIRSAERIVTLGPDARIERVRPARGGRVRFSAWAGEWIGAHGLVTECDALELGAWNGGASLHCGGNPGITWFPKAGRLVLWTRPGAGASITVAARYREGLCMEERDRAGDWVRVVWTNAALSFDGWARRDRMHGQHTMFGWTGTAGHGVAVGCGTGFAPEPGVDRGPAVLRAGADVFAERGRGPWARATADVTVHVRHVPGDDWARIERVPGVGESCGTIVHAWVPWTDVAFGAPDGG